jgi:hypothetical protein
MVGVAVTVGDSVLLGDAVGVGVCVTVAVGVSGQPSKAARTASRISSTVA